MKYLLTVIVLGLAVAAQADDAGRAEELYRRALAPGTPAAAKAGLLEDSLAAARSYAAAFELGRTYNALEQPDKAITAFEQAAATTTDPAQQARALGITARLYRVTGDPQGAIAALRQARRLQPSPELDRELRDLEASQGTVTAAAITGSLKRGLAKRSLGVEPAIDLRVNFALDRATLTAEGERQVAELGRALTDPAFAAYRVRVVGHTDRRGSDAHNDRLSLQRARTVKEVLSVKFGMAPDRIIVEGKGKREPLFMGEDEDAHALNRRVAVLLEG